MTSDEVAKRLGINPQIAIYHLSELNEKIMVLVSRRVNAPPFWSLGNEGRKYLIKNNLLS